MMKTYLILFFNNLSNENSDSYFKCAISGHRKESQKTKWYMVDNVTLDFFICPTIIIPNHMKKETALLCSRSNKSNNKAETM